MGAAPKTWIEVSRSALAANAASLRRLCGKTVELIAVVKSNAYGHGIANVVRALGDGGADRFAVDSVDEADEVRATGSEKPVLVLGYTMLDRLAEAVRKGYALTVYNPATVDALGRLGKKARLHLKLETGTSRQGILSEDLPGMVRRIKKYPRLVIEGVSTHFANIEDTTNPSYAMAQLGRFKKELGILAAAGVRPEVVHTACSAAVILYPETHFTAVRSGIGLYGLWPSPTTEQAAAAAGRKCVLRPVLAWKTRVAQVKRLPKGAPISYGLTERLGKDSVVAVLPIGYWDGLGRGLSSVGHVLVRGKRAKILGRVCMNMCVVDVTGIAGVRPEDEVVVIGAQGKERIAAEEVAEKAGTINYEVVTRSNPLLPRIMVR